ncbi:MAG: glycerate kinase [Bacteroidetes bacterium]|nr:MAG: glycerate kinase [Bacteroidota bacterium]
MNVLIAPDSFKDSLSASKVAQAIKEGVLSFSESAKCYYISASDGGEGFLNAVLNCRSDTNIITGPTVDPLGRAIEAQYLYDDNNRTAYIELAKASGLELLSKDERNPRRTSTLGTGIQIKDAIEKGANTIYLGIGGSATNDGGTGIAHALGFRFLTSEGNEIEPKGNNLQKIFSIEKPTTTYTQVNFIAVNDVLNPLFGKKGAAYTYAGQKGADKEEITQLDNGLEHLHTIVKKEFQIDEANTPGSGAAGGTAYGLKSFLNAKYISGSSFILKLSNFETLVSEKKIDVIITGEGKIDAQTSYGKFVYGMAQEAKKHAIPVLVVCGKLELDSSEMEQMGLHSAAEIYDATKPVAYSYDNATRLIAQKTKELLHKL